MGRKLNENKEVEEKSDGSEKQASTGGAAGTDASKLLNVQQQEAEAIKQKLPALIKFFGESENDIIVDTVPENEVRFVAKFAGLPVTETQPEKVTAAFITQVKEALAKKAEIEKAGGADAFKKLDDKKKEDPKK